MTLHRFFRKVGAYTISQEDIELYEACQRTQPPSVRVREMLVSAVVLLTGIAILVKLAAASWFLSLPIGEALLIGGVTLLAMAAALLVALMNSLCVAPRVGQDVNRTEGMGTQHRRDASS